MKGQNALLFLAISLLKLACMILPSDALVVPARGIKGIHKSSRCFMSGVEPSDDSVDKQMQYSRRSLLWGTSAAVFLTSGSAYGRPEPVNRPDLLPKEPGLNVIQIEKFLTSGQVKRLNEMLSKLEKDTSFRVRVLCQAYPQTPGLAIRDYWDLGKEGQKDDKYIVLVVDQFGGRGNVLNFNVGDGVKFALPNVFWTRLQGKYGSTFYVRDNGIDMAILNALDAIAQCLRAEYCVSVPDEGQSLKSLGMM